MKTRTLIFLLMVVGLTGCAGHSSQSVEESFSQSSVCQQNPFLQEFDCSLVNIEQSAEKGDPDAQYALGYLYYYGVGTVQDYQAASLWIQKAAAQGQPLAVKALQMINGQAYPAMGQVKAQQPQAMVQPKAAVTAASPAQIKPVKAPVSVPAPVVPASTVTAPSSSEQALLASTDEYTLQIMVSAHLPTVQQLIREYSLQNRAYYYPIPAKHQTDYVLLYGTYKTRAEANNALQQLPLKLRELQPWVKPMAVVKEEINR